MYWLMRSASSPPVSVVSPRNSTGLSLLRLRPPTVRWPEWMGWRSSSSVMTLRLERVTERAAAHTGNQRLAALVASALASAAIFSARSAFHWISFWTHSLSCGNSSVSLTRRTSSLTPGPRGHFCAHCLASSFDDTSRIQNPLNSSLASVYGPSVTTGGSALKSTTKPSSGGDSPSPASSTPALISSSL